MGSTCTPIGIRGILRFCLHHAPNFPLLIRAAYGDSLGLLARGGTQVSLWLTVCPPANGWVRRGI